jgi:transcription termination factor Rho
VTNTQEQLLPVEVTPAAGNGRAGGDAEPQQRSSSRDGARRGAARPAADNQAATLSALLLPELRQLAGSLGIPTAKLRKSELVDAIQSSQQSRGSQASSNRSATRRGAAQAPAAQAPAAQAPAAPAPAAETATAPTRPAGEIAGDAASGSSRAEQSTTAESAGSDRAPQTNGSGQNGGQSRRERSGQRSNSQNPPAAQTGQQGGNSSNAGGNSGTQNSGNQSSGGQNAQNAQNSQGSNHQGSSGQGGGNQSNQSSQGGYDDDLDGGRRRGRRYRDRRGRNRERTGSGGGGGAIGNADVEPTVSEDDVLVPVAGILDEIADKNAWFVRTEGYFASSDDVYVANSYVRRYGLRRGDAVTGAIRQVTGERREKYNPLVRLDTVNGQDPETSKSRVEFTKLTPLYPQQRLRLETEPHILTTRVIDLVMPIGKGQRALIVSPPKAGKTMVLQAIANAIATNNPEVHLMVVLIDERPEEVTDMQRSVKGEVIASTFDRRPQDHITVAELSIERAKRLVEMGHDVVVLLDSITRLGRAYNLGAPASGRILSGGVDSTALYPPKRFLGAARNIENGGSLTILATALVETGSAGDTVIFEEFKGTGNAELKLDRKIADKRVFPAVDVDQSSTRKEELLLSPDELSVTIKLRRVLHSLEQQQAIDLLLDRLKKTRTNLEFLMQIAKTTPGAD